MDTTQKRHKLPLENTQITNTGKGMSVNITCKGHVDSKRRLPETFSTVARAQEQVCVCQMGVLLRRLMTK
jgi:hypothetical protein